MSDLVRDNFSWEESKKENLLQEFQKVASELKQSAILSKFITQWIALNATTLMQRIGYNRQKISLLKGKKIVLNIGCLDYTNIKNENYLNVNTDLFKGKFSGADLLINIIHYDRTLLEIADGIVVSHVLEHISPNLAIESLKNCYAYLKTGGCIRVSVPYLGAYEQSNSIPPCQNVQNRMLAKNKIIYDWGHKFMYDAELLTALIEKVGFREVREVTFKEGLLGETDNPEHQLESIYLTGIKI